MQNFIVLGWIPGTHIQITFQLWMQLVVVLLAISLVVYVVRHRRALLVSFLSLYVRRIIRDSQLTLSLNR
jgi:hypothetical protein